MYFETGTCLSRDKLISSSVCPHAQRKIVQIPPDIHVCPALVVIALPDVVQIMSMFVGKLCSCVSNENVLFALYIEKKYRGMRALLSPYYRVKETPMVPFYFESVQQQPTILGHGYLSVVTTLEYYMTVKAPPRATRLSPVYVLWRDRSGQSLYVG